MKQLKPTEKEIENSILRYLKIKGIFAWKNQTTGIFDPKKKLFRKSKNPFHINGVSDILGIFKGQLLAIEIKRKGSKPTTEQVKFLETVNAQGGLGFVARSIEDVERFLEVSNA